MQQEIIPNGSLTKHEQVYNWLRSMIETNKFDEGTRLPTEEEIAAQFGISRMTVRKAMETLVDEGMIVRIKRKGTFLSNAYANRENFFYDLNSIVSFENISKGKNVKTSYRVYENKVIEASPKVTTELCLPNNSLVIRICRIISANGKPAFLEKSYFPYPQFKDVLDQDFNKPNILNSVIQSRGKDLACATQTLIAGLLDFTEKIQLQYDKAQEIPCIRQQNIIYDEQHKPIFAFHATFPGDKFRFIVSSDGYQPDLM